MTTQKKLGIWMDHANAHLMEFTTHDIETKAIGSKFTDEAEAQDVAKGESLMHNKEQYSESVYYKELSKEIANYDEVLLFGPTDAKAELLNLLRADSHFENIKIEVKPADKMTENQQHAFVKEYFTGPKN
ncbi:MAG: hypothetical protein JWQ38_1654 [Flavipsychrobacter sp.]|nr:hypothetical protein [Flavipsychrobacter sp.]